MLGIKVPNNIYAHISGIDLIKTSTSSFYVLEDNLRVPSEFHTCLKIEKQ